MGDQIDDAFDWLILIMSTINGIMIGLPETLEARKAVAGALIPPFFVLVVVWLLGHLLKERNSKVILKIYAWLNALFSLVMIGLIFADNVYGIISFLHGHVFVPFPPITLLWVALILVTPFLFFDKLVLPIYKEIYSDSRLLSSRRQLILLYVLACATFVILILPFLSAFAPARF